jgi:FkbM family methyltransferase
MPVQPGVRRLDLWGVLLLCAFSILVGWSVARSTATPAAGLNEQRRAEERSALRAAYGPEKHSEFEEEWIIRDFFKDERNRVFVDVGASHHQRFSNTWYLETSLEWSGIAVDALPQFAEGYREHRPKTRFFSFFVSDVSDDWAKLYVLEHHSLVSSATPEFTRQWGADVRQLEVKTITLNDLLTAAGMASFDFLSMDIELAEPKALAGFDIERYRPRLVCVEGHREVRQQILDYFARHGYVVVGKYLRADTQNLWFTPIHAIN